MKRTISLSDIVLLALVSLLGFSCKDDAPFYSIVIDCSPAVSQSTATIDIIGVTAADRQDWESISLQDYWAGDNKTRAELLSEGRAITRQLGVWSTNHYVLDLSVPDVKKAVEEKWKPRRVTDLLVMVRSAEQRRKFIPLKKKEIEKFCNSNAKAFRIYVQESGILVDCLDKAPKVTAK